VRNEPRLPVWARFTPAQRYQIPAASPENINQESCNVGELIAKTAHCSVNWSSR